MRLLVFVHHLCVCMHLCLSPPPPLELRNMKCWLLIKSHVIKMAKLRRRIKFCKKGGGIVENFHLVCAIPWIVFCGELRWIKQSDHNKDDTVYIFKFSWHDFMIHTRSNIPQIFPFFILLTIFYPSHNKNCFSGKNYSVSTLFFYWN